MRKSATPYLAGLGFATIFGFSFMLTRGALAHIAPFHLLGLRFAVAVVVLAFLRLVRVVTLSVKWSDYWELLPLALFQPLLYFSAETVGVQLTSSSQAGMMIAIIPIFVTILAAFVLREHPRPLQYPFILSSVGGVFFIMAMQNQGTLNRGSLGSILLLVAVLAGACYNIASRKASGRHSPLKITWVMMVTGAVAFNSITLLVHPMSVGQYFLPLADVWPAVLYLGSLSSVAAFFLINYSLSQITATQAAVFSNLTTIISIVAGVAFLDEPFHWYHWLGAVAILAGIWGTNYFASAKRIKMTSEGIMRIRTFFLLLAVCAGVVALAAGLIYLSYWNLLPKKSYTAEDFGITPILSEIDCDGDGIDDYTDIMLSARADARRRPKYDTAYFAGGYPPEDIGVCTDLIWRALDGAGYSLKDLVDADIAANVDAYPRVKGTPDPNIDFRRVVNLKVFFERNTVSLTLDPYKTEEWQPGDIVTFTPGHIAIVSDKRNRRGIPYIIHHGPQPVKEEDALLRHTITGHFRFILTEN